MASNTERADRLDRRRTLIAPFIGIVVLSANQWLFFGRDWNEVSIVQLALWLAMILVVLALIMTGGLWFVPKTVREIANDEGARQSRQRAFKGGFAAAVVMALVVFVASPFAPLDAQRAAHIIISVALGVALVVYGFEEGRQLD
ncbi:MAG: hypothetical protein J0H27_08330 [Xanthomonadales bacterium]|nr:hypothetical protein [Xanthomonadales bacterium]ODU92782.1 MAG: hypothetical protein ABT18_11155 [Rhodanobacter sp. SCN 66-43]OJY83852.1 MAG: hypothetical protein BGP23_14680 [Xanthomonadales bacterium 66-474]